MAEYFPEKCSWCRNEQVCQGGGSSIKHLVFEQSKGLDIALYKNIHEVTFLKNDLVNPTKICNVTVKCQEEEEYWAI